MASLFNVIYIVLALFMTLVLAKYAFDHEEYHD